MAQNSDTLALCLDEIASADFFVGLLGDRYGWVGDEYDAPNEPRFEWLNTFPRGRSITELEMHYGALQTDPAVKGRRAVFALRDPSVLEAIPDAARGDFVCPTAPERVQLEALKERVRQAASDDLSCQCRVLDSYASAWDKDASTGKPAVKGLEGFAEFFLDELWSLVVERYNINVDDPNSRLLAATMSPLAEFRLHQSFANRAGST